MRAHQMAMLVMLFAGVVPVAGCDAMDRVRSRLGTATTDTIVTATGSGLALGLQAPPALRPGDEGVLRLTLTNLTDTAVANVQLELIVPDWIEPMPPQVGDRPVSMSATGSGSTRFAYRMDDAPLAPKQLQTVVQRIRVPAAGAPTRSGAFTRIVRARLLTADARPLAEVESAIAVDSVALAASRSGTNAGTANMRDQLGPIELGMTAAAVRQAVPNAKDTTWSQEGTRQAGLLVPIENQPVLAVVSGDAVVRIEVANPAIRTAERLGVGSRMDELRAAYGLPCADATAGRVVVWFANAPGISFALDTPVPQSPAQLREHPDRIAGTAKVTRWWLSRAGDTCPN